jgi:hypothetical protein
MIFTCTHFQYEGWVPPSSSGSSKPNKKGNISDKNGNSSNLEELPPAGAAHGGSSISCPSVKEGSIDSSRETLIEAVTLLWNLWLV